MKRSSLNKIGKRGKSNLEANKILNQLFSDLGPRGCEINREGCENFPLNFCHRHDRDWYKGNVELLSSFEQVIIGCQYCHEWMDNHKEERRKIFDQLRGEEI